MDTAALRFPGAEVEKVVRGRAIFKNGDIGTCMYIVLQGEVQIKIGDRDIERIKPGGIFGEMALIDESLRAATALSVTDVTMLKLDEKHFTKLVHESPDFAITLLRIIVGRVRAADRLARLPIGKADAEQQP